LRATNTIQPHIAAGSKLCSIGTAKQLTRIGLSSYNNMILLWYHRISIIILIYIFCIIVISCYHRCACRALMNFCDRGKETRGGKKRIQNSATNTIFQFRSYCTDRVDCRRRAVGPPARDVWLTIHRRLRSRAYSGGNIILIYVFIAL